jgi:hypothetical protein
MRYPLWLQKRLLLCCRVCLLHQCSKYCSLYCGWSRSRERRLYSLPDCIHRNRHTPNDKLLHLLVSPLYASPSPIDDCGCSDCTHVYKRIGGSLLWDNLLCKLSDMCFCELMYGHHFRIYPRDINSRIRTSTTYQRWRLDVNSCSFRYDHCLIHSPCYRQW